MLSPTVRQYLYHCLSSCWMQEAASSQVRACKSGITFSVEPQAARGGLGRSGEGRWAKGKVQMSLKCPLQGLPHPLLAEGEDGYSGALTLTQHLIFPPIYSWSKINTPSSAGNAEHRDSSMPAISKFSNSWCITNGCRLRHWKKLS